MSTISNLTTRRDGPSVVATKEEVARQVALSYSAIREMRKQGQIDDAQLYKMTVSLAYEFSVIGEMESAVSMLQGIPVEYFKNTQQQQMDQDGTYRQVATELAQKLVDSGIVSLNKMPAVNMPSCSGCN